MTRSSPSCAGCAERRTPCASACSRCPNRSRGSVDAAAARRAPLRARRRARGSRAGCRSRGAARRPRGWTAPRPVAVGSHFADADVGARTRGRANQLGRRGVRRDEGASAAARAAPSSTRLNKYEAWLHVRVAADRLDNATTRAMQIARGYGGYVASVDMNTPGKQGTASVVLRVPVARVEDAVLRLGKLGEVTAQRIRIQDLQRQANVFERQIVALQATIAKLERKLAAGGLAPDERIRLQYQLDEAKRALAQKTKARASTVREGTLATVSLAFATPQAGSRDAAPSRAARANRPRRRRVPRSRARVAPLRGDRARADRAARRRTRLRRARRPPPERSKTARAEASCKFPACSPRRSRRETSWASGSPPSRSSSSRLSRRCWSRTRGRTFRDAASVGSSSSRSSSSSG